MRNVAFFDNLAGESSVYWLGFLCADGHVYKSGKQVSILLGRKDAGHLSKFAAIFDKPVRESSYIDVRTNKRYYSVRCVLSSKSFCSAILNYGIPQQKTASLDGKVFDHIPPHLLHHFVRGYFDGNGSIGSRGVAEYRLTISSTRAFLQRLSREVSAAARIEHRGYISDGKGCSSLYWIGLDRIRTLSQWMYKDATVYLERKKSVFDKMPLYRGTSRYKYVYWSPLRSGWLARRRVDGKMSTIGCFKTEDEAAEMVEKDRLARAAQSHKLQE